MLLFVLCVGFRCYLYVCDCVFLSFGTVVCCLCGCLLSCLSLLCRCLVVFCCVCYCFSGFGTVVCCISVECGVNCMYMWVLCSILSVRFVMYLGYVCKLFSIVSVLVCIFRTCYCLWLVVVIVRVVCLYSVESMSPVVVSFVLVVACVCCCCCCCCVCFSFCEVRCLV